MQKACFSSTYSCWRHEKLHLHSKKLFVCDWYGRHQEPSSSRSFARETREFLIQSLTVSRCAGKQSPLTRQ